MYVYVSDTMQSKSPLMPPKNTQLHLFLTLKCMSLNILLFLNNYPAYGYTPTLFHLPYFRGHLFWNPTLAEYEIHSGNLREQFTS